MTHTLVSEFNISEKTCKFYRLDELFCISRIGYGKYIRLQEKGGRGLCVTVMRIQGKGKGEGERGKGEGKEVKHFRISSCGLCWIVGRSGKSSSATNQTLQPMYVVN